MSQKTCPTCFAQFDEDVDFCPHDGSRLYSDTEKREDKLLGAILAERYRVKAKLGSGGMGSVYRAYNMNAEMDVALKVLDPVASNRGSLVQRFQREKRLISRLRHPNILKLLDSFTTDDEELVIVTELVEGETLAQCLRGGPMGPRSTLYIIREVADALVEAHDSGVVHRDLKPSNLMLEQAGDRQMVKVLDFGIAKDLSDDGLSTSGTLGTPSYMSPEQIHGGELDGRSDIYSLGCIAYECLSGQVLFSGGTAFDIIRRHLTDVPQTLAAHKLTREIPAGLQAMLERMLEKEPEERYQSARELRTAVDTLLGQWSTDDSPIIQRQSLDNSVGFAATFDSIAPQSSAPDDPSAPLLSGIGSMENIAALGEEDSGTRASSPSTGMGPIQPDLQAKPSINDGPTSVDDISNRIPADIIETADTLDGSALNLSVAETPHTDSLNVASVTPEDGKAQSSSRLGLVAVIIMALGLGAYFLGSSKKNSDAQGSEPSMTVKHPPGTVTSKGDERKIPAVEKPAPSLTQNSAPGVTSKPAPAVTPTPSEPKDVARAVESEGTQPKTQVPPPSATLTVIAPPKQSPPPEGANTEDEPTKPTVKTKRKPKLTPVKRPRKKVRVRKKPAPKSVAPKKSVADPKGKSTMEPKTAPKKVDPRFAEDLFE